VPDPKPTFTNELRVKIAGLDLKEIDPQKTLGRTLGAAWVERSVNLPTAFHIQFTDNYQQYLKNFGDVLELGAPVELFVVVDGQGKDVPLMTGEITGIETDYDGATMSTVIRGLDHGFKMMRGRRTKAWADLTATEIVQDLAKKDKVLVGHVDPSPTRYKWITQPNVSDWQFVTELAARNGMFADFDGEGLLRFRRLPPATVPVNEHFAELPTVLQVGANVLRCRTGISAAAQTGSVTVRGWDMEVNDKVTSTMVVEAGTGRVIKAGPEAALKHGIPRPHVETGRPYGSQSEADTTARALAGELSSVFAELEILVAGNPGLVPGQTIELRNAGASFDGFYTVTTARHEFPSNGHYVTWVMVTGRQVRNLYGLASGAGESPGRFPGVVNALVTDINDPEKKDRVQVRFPWLDDTYLSRWARTMQFGGRGGGVISPSVDDEVLVAFDRGDIDYPYVLGGLYGHEANLPSHHDVEHLVTDGHVNRLSLVSRAGHRLELLDAKEMQGVRLRSGNKRLTVFLDQLQTEIEISSDGKVSIKGDAEVSVAGKTSVSVSSDASISLNAPKLSIEAGAVNITGAVTMNGALTVNGLLNQEGPAASFKNAAFTVTSGINTITPPAI
jgi:phage protein D/phage baseplate assembly protein gpV